MMQIVASNKSENRMSLSAVAACMAPLLLRPLLAGDCELEDDFHMGGDGSVQLLQAAAAANHAQAIVIILLEHYERIFNGETLQYSSELYSETEGSEEDEDDYDDEDSTENEIVQANDYHNAENDLNAESEADNECTSSGEHDECSNDLGGDLSDNKASDCHYSDNSSSKINENPEAKNKVDLVGKQNLRLLDDAYDKQSKASSQAPQNSTENVQGIVDQNSNTFSSCINDAPESSGHIPTSESPAVDAVNHALCNSKTADKTKEPGSGKITTIWGRTSARKNLSMENIDYQSDDENAVQRLEATKSDLESKLTEEVKENELLQSSLELRKQALHNHRVALQQDVERLLLQLENERALRASLDAGLLNIQPGLPISAAVDSKTKKNLEEIAVAEADISYLKQEAIDLQGKINQQKRQISDSTCESCGQNLYKNLQFNKKNEPGDVSLKIAPRHSEKSQSSEDISSALVSSNENTQMLDAAALQNMQKSASMDCSKSEIASSPSLRQKQPPRKQRHSLISTKSLCPANSSSSREAPTDTSRRTSPKGEDTVSGSASALTRLTNRLNLLKERRVQ